MRTRRRNGSSLIFALMLIVSMTAIILSTAELGVTSERQYQSELSKAHAENSIDGIGEIVKSRGVAQTLADGTFTANIGGRGQTYSVANNNAVLARTYQLNSTIEIGERQYVYRRIVEGRQPAHPCYYALFSAGNLTSNGGVETMTSNSGGVHSNGKASLASSSIIDGDLTAVNGIDNGTVGTEQTDPAAKTVTGGIVSDIVSALAVQYLIGANNIRLLDTQLKGMSFPNPASATAPYHMRYYALGITMTGTYSGVGSLVVSGNLSVPQNITYATSNSRMVVIVGGNMEVAKEVTELAGCYFVCGNITMESGRTAPLSVTGNLWSLGNLNAGNQPLRITPDRVFWNDRNEATRHKMPGFWPLVTTPGLLR